MTRSVSPEILAILDREYKVLDHGYVKVIEVMGTDEGIVEAARMSTDRGFISWEPYRRCKNEDCALVETLDSNFILMPPAYLSKPVATSLGCHHTEWEKFPNGDLGLLDTLWRKKHATPFEMGEILIEVAAPLFVFREWHRHRTQSYNEFSARYSVMPNLHYVPSEDRLKQLISGNKQASSHVSETDADLEMMRARIEAEQNSVYDNYDEMINAGVPKEVARVNTPVSRYSKMRAKTDLRNWLAFLNLRIRPDAQWEIRQYANVVAEIVKAAFPRSFSFFEEYDLYGAHLSRTELRIVRDLISGVSMIEALKQGGLTGRKKDEFLAKIQKGGEEILA